MKVLGIVDDGSYVVYDSIEEYDTSGDWVYFSHIIIADDFDVRDPHADLSDCEDSPDDDRGLADDYGFREDRENGDGDDSDHGIRIGYVGEL